MAGTDRFAQDLSDGFLAKHYSSNGNVVEVNLRTESLFAFGKNKIAIKLGLQCQTPVKARP